MKWQAIVFVLLATIFTTPGQFFYKLGAQRLPILWMNWELALAVGLYVVAGIFFILALRYGAVTQVYPILSTTYVWITLAGIFFFNENVTMIHWIGVAIILAGVLFIIFGGKR